jgi:hypothetical protein
MLYTNKINDQDDDQVRACKKLLCAVLAKVCQDFLRGERDADKGIPLTHHYWEAKKFLFSEDGKMLMEFLGFKPRKSTEHLKKLVVDFKKGINQEAFLFATDKRMSGHNSSLVKKRIQDEITQGMV